MTTTNVAPAIAPGNGAAAPGSVPALAYEPNILDLVVSTLAGDGMVGESRLAKLLYLGFTSRFMEPPARPLCVVVTGPASTGKSTVTDRVMKLMPASAYHFVTGMSNKALAYSDTASLKHRVLVVAEAAGLVKDGDGAMMLRSLLSEGRLCYETVEKDAAGAMVKRRIEIEGPTGLVTTTTKPGVEAELATRMFAAPIDASPAQTKRVMRSISDQWAGDAAGGAAMNPAGWHELQDWLADAEHRAIVPFIRHVDDAIPPDANRLRRDFGALATLIVTHAILHQATRGRDRDGRIIATLDDYAVVRELVADIVAEGVGASVSKQVRDVVNAVRALGNKGVMQTQIADHLGCHKTTVEPYVATAIERGWLIDTQQTRGMPHSLVTGGPLPAEREVLPRVEAVRQAMASTP